MLNAVVGFAGVHATLWALEHGVDLALANKESLVAAGELALAARERGGGRILPVDSEHSALFQCLEGREPEQIDTLVLTGSGGPFRGRTRAELEDVTPEQALAHPTWRMGPKITMDSATLANKGLEVIEAHYPLRRAVRPDRGRDPADVDRALARPLPRRRRARAPRLPGHARADLVRAHVPRARRDAAAAARPHLAHARVLAARHRDVPDARRSRAPPGRRAAARRASTTPRTRSPSPPSSPAGCRSSRSRRSWGRRSRPPETDPVRDLDDLVEVDRAARALAEGALAAA